MVEIIGLEPMTSCLQSTRSPNWAIPPVVFGFFLVLCVVFDECDLFLIVRDVWVGFGFFLILLDSWLFYFSSFSLFFFDLLCCSFLVEMIGFEPMTSCLRSTRSPNWATPPIWYGFLLGFSYFVYVALIFILNFVLFCPFQISNILLVGQGGLEPPTPRLSSVCSNQLSY